MLGALTSVSLASNQIGSVHSELFGLPLQELDLTDTGLAAIPERIVRVAGSLRVLRLGKSRICF